MQWIWPVPLFIGGYFAPESPWNSIRRGRYDEARQNLAQLRAADTTQEEIDATVAYIDHTTRLEKAETSGATFIACFQGTNLRRTEIVSDRLLCPGHRFIFTSELRHLDGSDPVRQRSSQLRRCVPPECRLVSGSDIQHQHRASKLLCHRRHHILVLDGPGWQGGSIHRWSSIHVCVPARNWWSRLRPFQLGHPCGRYRLGHPDPLQYDHRGTSVLPAGQRDAFGSTAVQDHCHRPLRLPTHSDLQQLGHPANGLLNL